MPSPADSLPDRRPTLAVALASALFAVPLFLARFPPMVDYPQHLAMAAVYRFWGDAARGFAEHFTLTWWRPHGAWELLTAGLSWLMPIEIAGKLVVALSVAAVGPAALAVLRRRGGDGWWPWALAALACAYGYAFWFGFVGSLAAYPLCLAGVALADRVVAGEGGRRALAGLFALGLLFYAVHLQFLLVLFGAAGWLTICRRVAGGGWRWRGLAALAPAAALAVGAVAWMRWMLPAEVVSALERALAATPTAWNPLPVKLATMGGLTFGVHPGGAEHVAALLLLAVGVLAVLFRRPAEAPAGEAAASFEAWTGSRWWRHRFAGLALALLAVYLLVPERVSGFLVAGRLVSLVAMVACCALPAPRLDRRRLLALPVAALVVWQLAVVTLDVRDFDRQADGLSELLAATEPGRDVVGLVFEPATGRVPAFPVLAHLPAYYQVRRGGRVLVSKIDLTHAPVAYREGSDWGTLPIELSERNPGDFDLGRHGGRFDYALVHGDRGHVARLFGGRSLPVRSAGSWHLVELETAAE